MKPEVHPPSKGATWRRPVACAVAVGVLGVGATTSSISAQTPVASVAAENEEVFVGIEPFRLLDTRSGIGAPSAGPFTAGEIRTLVATADDRIPADATSLAINTTLPRSASEGSYITIWPTGSEQPFTSTNNATPGMNVPNAAVTALGDGGAIDVFNEKGEIHIVIDVVGYYTEMDPLEAANAPGGQLHCGEGPPSPTTIGFEGDLYVDERNGDLYEFRGGQWIGPVISFTLDGEGNLSEPHVLAGSGAPDIDLGSDADVYLDITTNELYGPKIGGGWGDGRPLVSDGSEFLSGAGSPSVGLGSEGDLYIDTDASVIYGPKSVTGWGSGLPFGPDGTASSGSTFLSGSGAPAGGLGVEGDLYLDTSGPALYGPKSDTGWGARVDVGPDGVGETGSTFLSGTDAPAAGLGVEGDLYLDSDDSLLYGPKSVAGWGVGLPVGPDGVGSTLLVGDGAPDTGSGEAGDTYLDTTNLDFYGPKIGTSWGVAVSLDGGPTIIVDEGAPGPDVGDIGDVYFNSITFEIYGPKTVGGWGVGSDLDDPVVDSAVLTASATDHALLSIGLGLGTRAVPFPQTDVDVGGSITRIDDSTFRLADAGAYRVSFDLEDIDLSILGNVEIRIDGVAVDAAVSLATVGLPYTDSVIVEAGAGSELEIVVTGISVALGTGEVTGSIAVELIATD